MAIRWLGWLALMMAMLARLVAPKAVPAVPHFVEVEPLLERVRIMPMDPTYQIGAICLRSSKTWRGLATKIATDRADYPARSSQKRFVCAD